MLNMILLIFYIAAILAVIFLERKNPTEALLWVLVMVCIPYAGVLLYLVFGSTTAIKLTSVFRRKRLSQRLPAAKGSSGPADRPAALRRGSPGHAVQCQL